MYKFNNIVMLCLKKRTKYTLYYNIIFLLLVSERIQILNRVFNMFILNCKNTFYTSYDI